MSYSLNAAGHVPTQAADGTAQDAAAVELELYEALTLCPKCSGDLLAKILARRDQP